MNIKCLKDEEIRLSNIGIIEIKVIAFSNCRYK